MHRPETTEFNHASLWKGYLKLALVSCPIALHAACSSAERIAFRQINKATGNRLRQQLIDEETREPHGGAAAEHCAGPETGRQGPRSDPGDPQTAVKCPDHDRDMASRLSNLGDTVDLVLDGFGTFGHADHETDPRQANRQTVLPKHLSGQHVPCLRIAACKTAEGGSRDVAANVAQGDFGPRR